MSLVRREPSLEAARLAAMAKADAERLAANTARVTAKQAAAADRARIAAEQAAAADRTRIAAEQAAAAESARLAAEAAARQAEADRIAAEARDARVRPFVAAFAGKQQRQYDGNPANSLGRLPDLSTGFGLPLLDVPAFFDTLAGVKGGVALRMSDHWTFAPAVGVAANLDVSERSTLFGDAELDFVFGPGAYIGTGLTFWDITHSENFTLELTRFRGHLTLMVEGVHDAQEPKTVPTGVSRPDGRVGPSRAYSRRSRPRV